MKKILSCGAALAAVVVVTGCRMCSEPIYSDPTCIENSHLLEVKVRPNAVSLTRPNIAGSRELFRPVFRAGEKRITVVGEGVERKIAINDAIAKFLAKADCDYIVGVTTIVTKKTHPTWRFFSTSNYTVTLSGLPIHLDKLACETLEAEKADAMGSVDNNCEDEEPAKKDAPSVGIPLPNVTIEKAPHVCPAPEPGLIKLDNIKVDITATGKTDDKAGVVFPIK